MENKEKEIFDIVKSKMYIGDLEGALELLLECSDSKYKDEILLEIYMCIEDYSKVIKIGEKYLDDATICSYLMIAYRVNRDYSKIIEIGKLHINDNELKYQVMRYLKEVNMYLEMLELGKEGDIDEFIALELINAHRVFNDTNAIIELSKKCLRVKSIAIELIDIYCEIEQVGYVLLVSKLYSNDLNMQEIIVDKLLKYNFNEEAIELGGKYRNNEVIVKKLRNRNIF